MLNAAASFHAAIKLQRRIFPMKLKPLMSLIAAAAFGLASMAAHAGGYNTSTTISTIEAFDYSSLAFVTITGSITSNPTCNTMNRWAIDSSTAGGKMLLSMVMTAKALGTNVAMTGTGACNLTSTSETLYSVKAL